MKRIIETEKIPIKLWVDHIEPGALQQAKDIANIPHAFHHVAIMPDCHEGFGMPIGGVLATKNIVIPNAVGVDIGCGMCALKTSLQEITHKQLNRITNEIKKIIPVGFKHHKQPQDKNRMPEVKGKMPVVEREYDRARCQLGTLGGGNHFIEIQKGSDRHIWIMVHSGSRNLGKQVADHYYKKAVQIREKNHKNLKTPKQLSSLLFDSVEGERYMKEMQYCTDFAQASRKLMMDFIKWVFREYMGDITFSDFINIAHNYAALEKHFGHEVVVHRKGATSAREGEKGIIPGSQGANSYIVTGKGNPESFNSCSHGAGRVMGRREAQRKLDMKQEIDKLNKKGIIHSIRKTKDLDEASGAYKNITQVMEDQKDLVEVILELEPLAVIKG